MHNGIKLSAYIYDPDDPGRDLGENETPLMQALTKEIERWGLVWLATMVPREIEGDSETHTTGADLTIEASANHRGIG